MAKYDMKPGESEEKYFKRLAKAADQRLVRLEKLAKQKDFEAVTKFAYARAMRDINVYNPGGSRFNTAIQKDFEGKLDRRILRERTADVLHFLGAETSTKSGIIKDYSQRADTFNRKYGTNMTWRDLAEYFNKAQNVKLERQGLASKTALRAIGIIQQIEKNIVEGVQGNLNVTATDVEKDTALKVLRNRKYLAGHTYSIGERHAIKKALKTL